MVNILRVSLTRRFKFAVAVALALFIAWHVVPPAMAVQYQIVYVPVTVIVNGKPVVIRRPVVRPVASPVTFELSVTIVGDGTVASTQSGITCAPDCSEKYTSGTAITLKATPANGQVFAGWSGGGCSGLADCTVMLSAATTVTATFSAAAASNPPAKLGDPSKTPFNEIVAVLDRLHHVPKHAIASVNATMPPPLASATMPSLPDIKVLARRDAVIFYLPNIADAADYRAYAVSKDVSFVDTPNGKQPRGAVIACAGFRRRPYEPILTTTGQRTRELLQALELPGFVASGNYTIVVEALKTPCPFTGMPGHTDAMIVAADKKTHGDIKSFASVRNIYGNEFLNGQGAVTPWSARNTSNQLGLAVPPTNTEFPKDPLVIARSALAVTLPFADEPVNAPIVDVGSNALFDDFSKDLVMTPVPFGDPWHVYSLGSIPAEWAFWGMGLAHADGENYGIRDFHGLQVFQRHGRLYTTYGDWEQGVAGTFNFSSLKTLPQELDDAKYLHSFFRVSSDATGRRYWAWTLCGGATREELIDPATRIPRIQPLILPNIVWAQASNPTVQFTGQPNDPTRYNKECLQLAQIGINEAHWPKDGGDRASNQIATVLFPAGVEKGQIGLGTANSGGGDADFSTAYSWRLDAAGNRAGPLVEPFDQYQPLTHFDVFVRRDRLLVFINGRQGICVNMKSRPLTMKYGLVTYGSLLYHTGAEIGALEDADAAEPQYRLNTPIADTRIWDAVGHSEKIDIPPQFKVDESTCFAPASTAVH